MPINPNGKLDQLDTSIIIHAMANPNDNQYQLGKKIQKMGIADQSTVYRRLQKNAYLRGEIQKIRQFNSEFVSRELIPEALKIHKKILKDQDIEPIKKKDWVFQAEKMEFRLDQPAPAGNTINIQTIERLQMIVGADMAKQLTTTPEDKP